MKVAMMQPAFLPWQGFFELIYKSDRFLILDDFQFSVQSYHQRNRFFVNKGQVDWYTVPVQKCESFGMALKDVRINDYAPWRVKMWKRVQQNYSKASFYSLIAPRIQEWLFKKVDSLAAQNIAFIKLACDILHLKREILLSSQFPSAAKRSERVAELLRMNSADSYYCAKGSFDYMLADGLFPLSNVIVYFQDFTPKTYPQIGSPNDFIPYLSVLDALMNVGPERTVDLIAHGTTKWLTWDKMMIGKKELLQELMAGEKSL
jgi:hypothetical protein